MRFLRGGAVLAASLACLSYVFRLGSGQFQTTGLGDWIDPYFINLLLEHWYHALRTLSDPFTLPIFFPERHALGYSHGLILFAPFYAAVRPFLHPFQAAATMLFLVIEVGILSLYVLLRRLGVSFAESFVLTAFFATSPNVMNGTTAVWMQRASVFLIPPILLVASQSRGRARAAVAGLLVALLYVQDFYTAHFALLLAACFAGAAITVESRWPAAARRGAGALWTRMSSRDRAVAVVTAIAAAAACVIFLSGGGQVRILGVRLSARDWSRPAMLAFVGAVFLLWRDRPLRDAMRTLLDSARLRAFLAGAAVGAAIFAWIYLPAFRDHPGFSQDEVWGHLAESNPYPGYRPFELVAALAALAWIPPFGVARRVRMYGLWLAAVSVLVLILPLKFGAFSLWTAVVARLPGFSAIRDPGRIIYLYELAVAVAAGVMLARSRAVAYRAAVTLVAVIVVAATWNRERFDYERPNAPFDRWVASPIAIDPACRSFFMTDASAEYMSRSPNMFALYGNDAAFVALRYSIPTLNGYSAWLPPEWDLTNPHDDTYPGRVQRWISAHELTGVCPLDIDRRTIGPPVR